MSYRGITLACAMYNLYCGVLNSRLVAWTEVNGLIEDEQNGFRADRSCVDHLNSLTNIIETQKLLKQSTFTAFIDFSKAFDRINRDFPWLNLEHLSLSSEMLNTIKAIYNDVSCCVRINGVKTDFFNVSSGLKQGCSFSPLLFNLFLNDLSQEIKNCGNIEDEIISLLLYADDLCFICDSEEGLREMLNILYTWCEHWSMVVNGFRADRRLCNSNLCVSNLLPIILKLEITPSC